MLYNIRPWFAYRDLERVPFGFLCPSITRERVSIYCALSEDPAGPEKFVFTS